MQSYAFLPDLEDVPHLEPLANKAQLSAITLDAARIIDDVFEVAKRNMNQSDNYLQACTFCDYH